jgi:hypothetical protein
MAEGYMPVDSLNAEEFTAAQNRFSQGKVGMVYAHNWLNNYATAIMAVERISLKAATAKILMLDPPSGPSGNFGGWGLSDFYRGYCINKRMSPARIDKCLKLFDYLASDEGIHLVTYGIEGVNYEIDPYDGRMVSLLPRDSDGIYSDLKYSDGAAFLQQLTWWTCFYNDVTQINADIIVPRQQRSAVYRYWEDYPDVQTDAHLRYGESAFDFFKTSIANLQLDKNNNLNNLSAWAYDAKTFGWGNLTQVSDNFNAAWNEYVQSYLGDYKGSLMIGEYNRYIADGKAQKRVSA